LGEQRLRFGETAPNTLEAMLKPTNTGRIAQQNGR
jgi:hypothetical protein